GRELYSVERSVSKPSSERDSKTLIAMLLFESRAGFVIPELRKWEIPVKLEDELLKLPTELERRSSEKTFLGKQKGPSGLQVSWVIGEKIGNQLWVEKDAFLPSRLILKQTDEYTFQFDSYRLVKEISLPRSVTVIKGAEQVFRQEFQDFSVNTAATVEAQKPVVGGFTEVGEAADAELRELIRKYYSVLR
ncbi:MAG: hypothetical protein KGQ59_08795, partial [Bdellovibrionales bacterium]|nr:hypothetical protein [Bdellovibrionales bacterium]